MTDLSDPIEVERANLKAKDLRKQQLNDIRTVLSNSSGRRLLWRLLGKCNTFGSVYSEKSSTMAYLSGQQDLGHFLMAEIVEADENLLLRMMKDNKKGANNDN